MFRPARTTEEQAKRAERGIGAYVELSEKLREQGCEVIFEVLPSELAGLTDLRPLTRRPRSKHCGRRWQLGD